MRVVFLTHNYPRHPGDLAGGFLRTLALALRARGHDLRVVAPSDGGRGGSDDVDGIPVTRVRYASADRERYAYTGRMEEAVRSPAGWLALGRMIGAMRRAARLAAMGSGEVVVHAHWWLPAGLAAPPELATVVTLHGTDARLLERIGVGPLARRVLRSGRSVTAVSRPVAALVAKTTGRPVTAIPITPMPLVLSRRRSAGGAGLVAIGRLTGQKRFHLALAAHQRLLAERPSLRLTVIGDGPERSRLEDLSRQLGTTGLVRFVGQVAPSEVAEALGDADLCLFPAVAEGLGLAAVEALAAGVPVVVCRDGGGLLDIIQEPEAGLVVEPDPAAMARATLAILGRTDYRTAAALEGDRWRDRLDPGRVAQQFEAIYSGARDG